MYKLKRTIDTYLYCMMITYIVNLNNIYIYIYIYIHIVRFGRDAVLGPQLWSFVDNPRLHGHGYDYT